MSSTTNAQHSDYTIVFVGDSMTEYLGNFDELRRYLSEYYPNKNFLLLNYGFSATNILSLPSRITDESTHSGRIFKPIDDIPFDLIFIESFANNPLSDYSLDQGLKIQNDTLDKVTALLTQKHPKSKIIFMTTIAPNRERYAEGVVNLLPDERKKWADERIAYMKNHIAYAKNHGFPILNIYQDSLTKNGDGNIDYINTNDFVHPSPTGIYFISSEIAKFIYANKLLGN